MNRLLLAAALLVPLAGCRTHLNTLPASQPLARPMPIDAPAGTYVHAPSHYAFPESVEGFSRVQLMQYDTGGLDVSAGYNGSADGCPVAMTIYVYPTPRMSFVGADPGVVRSVETGWLEAGYRQAKRELEGAHPDARLQEEGARPDGGLSRRGIYLIGDVTSEVYVFVEKDAWYVELRHSYPTACAGLAQDAMKRFYGTWHTDGS